MTPNPPLELDRLWQFKFIFLIKAQRHHVKFRVAR